MRAAILLTFAIGLIPAAALAQGAPPGMMGSQIRGTLQEIKGNTFTIVSDAGPSYAVIVPATAKIQIAELRSLADIHVGSFVGSGATKDPSGKFTAREVHIFAAAGSGEGQRQMGADPAHIMTNASVTSIVPTPPGETITLSFGTRSQQIYLPADVPVTGVAPGNKSEIKPGTKLFVLAAPAQHGHLQAVMVMFPAKGALLP